VISFIDETESLTYCINFGTKTYKIMSMQEEVYNFIKTLKPSVPDFEPDQNLLEDEILDSVAMMELVLWSEEQYGFTVDTDDLTPENFATLNAITEYIEKMSSSA